MATSDRTRWDAKYESKQAPALVQADAWLRQHAEALPAAEALDLACGMGHNAIWLAQRGWRVDAVDISTVGLSLAQHLADLAGLKNCPPIRWIAADLDLFEPPEASYDLITVFRFLDRERLPRIIESTLRPGGLLLYETFSERQLSRADNHLTNPQFTLRRGELPTLFPQLDVIAAEELDLSDRSVSRLAARKPA